MILFVPLGGFLGAGKTTTMIAAALRLEMMGERVAVVMNDQGVDLVDTHLARQAGLDGVEEVTGGCFCCRFDDLAQVVARLEIEVTPTVILAEAVGSCTDLQSTVIRPLRHFCGAQLNVAPLTVLVDPGRYAPMSRSWQQPEAEPDLAYLYRHQLDEADIIAINKIDLLESVEIPQIRHDIHDHFPEATVVALSAATGAGLDDVIDLWTQTSWGPERGHRPFAVDYQRYGAAESELAWTNQTFDLRANRSTLAPAVWVERFLTEFSDAAARAATTIGHVKVHITTPRGTTKASLTEAGGRPVLDEDRPPAADQAVVRVNARVQMSPDDLDELIDSCMQVANTSADARSGERKGDIFRPGFPVPVHRM